jgi:CRISPR-associated protein Cas2
VTQRTLYIAAYDVAEPARLRRALQVAKEFATGGQKSVFECFLTAVERRELIIRMREVLEAGEDRFALVRVEPRARPRTLGIAVPPADPDYFYVG